MPEYENKYHRAILQARQSIVKQGVPKDAERLLMRSYGKLIEDIASDFSEGEITEQRYTELTNAIRKRFTVLSRQLELVFEGSKRTVINKMMQAHLAGTAAVEASTGIALEVIFNGVPQQTLELMMLRRDLGAKDYKAVLKRNIVDAVDDIENYLRSAISRGVNARRMTQELSGIMASGNENVLKLVDNGKLTRSATRKALREGSISRNDYKAARSLIYETRRIVDTETLSALRTSNVICQQKSPVIKGSRWQVSTRHDGLRSSPDICDIYASADLFGLGKGVYPCGNVPSSAHPFCSCRISSVLKNPSEFDKPGYRTTRPNSVSQRELKQYMPDATDRSLEVTAKNVNGSLMQAYKVSTGDIFDEPIALN